MMQQTPVRRTTAPVLGARIDTVTWSETLQRLDVWVSKRESRYVCICNVHSIVTASRDSSFAKVVNEADMVTPDGAPVAWVLRKLGFAGQQRINGPDLMWGYCEQANKTGQAIYLYGSTERTLDLLQQRLKAVFPGLRIAGAYSPPFRQLSAQEDAEVVAQINASGAGVVFVSLGCPKQEFWMADHCGKINAVMVGVGAAFDYHAGTVKRAPLWMQNHGLEWLHRLCSEPGRLWRRYLVTNTLFILGIAGQLWRLRFGYRQG
jgi:N-acetylglucosaminyldiphosphoundecaprenol N-acetyl-beta-D-mannosaminyltransferase